MEKVKLYSESLKKIFDDGLAHTDCHCFFEREFVLENATKLLEKTKSAKNKSDWALPADSKYTYKNGRLEIKINKVEELNPESDASFEASGNGSAKSGKKNKPDNGA
jgi:hypothetical protein